MSDFTKIFHTVPLIGNKLTRNEEGLKVGVAFPKDGWSKYATSKNTNNAPLLAAIALKDFIGLDFDTDESFNQALQIDSECKYVAKSDFKGGHLLYRYNDTTPLKNTKVPGKLDVQMSNSLIYLATPANTTKVLLTDPIESLDDLTVMPLSMQLYVENLILKYQNENMQFDSGNVKQFRIDDDSTLGYVLKDIRQDSVYSVEIFKLLTPRKYKPNKLHPNDIPDGEGSDYLQSIRTRLALDSSISESVFRNVMHYINAQWDSPMPASRIDNDCSYQIQKATIDGNKAWSYNEDWDKEGLIVKDRYLSAVEFLFDTTKSKFLEFNRTTKDIIIHENTTNARNSYLSKKRGKVPLNDMITKAIDVEIINDPTKGSYLLPHKPPYKPEFNTFIPSIGTQILRNPDMISEPRYPEVIMKFLENLIPNEKRRNWLLQFIKHKHKTYDYSPIYIVLAGVGGAGKGVFVNQILNYFSGMERIQDLDLDKLQNNFNAWKTTTDYGHIDEAGEGASKNEIAKMVAELKKLTGSPIVSVSYKGKDISGKDNARHFITPILNTNVDVKVITDLPKNDRRFVYIKCPNKMRLISDNNDSKYVKLIQDELPHFAHYLATQVKNIDQRHYTSNESQKDSDYLEFMEQTVDPVHSLLDAVEEGDLHRFTSILSEEFFVPNERVDSLFDARLQNDDARVLLYNTPNLAPLCVTSIFDLAMEVDSLDPVVLKKKLSHTKKASTYKDDRGALYKYNYISFKGNYVTREDSDNVVEGVENVEL